MKLSRQKLLMKLGAARERARTAWRLVMIDIDLKLTRRSEPEAELKLLLGKLKLELPAQPSPKITAAAIRSGSPL